MDHRTQLPRALPRRQFLRMAGAAAVAAPVAALGWQASAPAAPVTGRPCGPDGRNVELHELFADDVNIASVDGFTRGVVPASRLDDPVIQPELPWETYATYLYGTVLPDQANGGYRMWYHTGRICYAHSDDGVHWEKPALGLNYIDGQDSNWVFNPTSTTAPELSSVLYEPDDPDPNRRYKMMFSTGNSFFNVAFSPDGMHWTEPSPTAVLRAGSEIANVVRDPATGLYLAYIRSEPAKAYPVGLSGRRRIALCTSPDFLNWSAKTPMIDPDAIDDAWVTDPSVQRTEFYGMAGVPYAGQWLGLLPTFRVTEIISPHPSTQSAFEGPIHCELISSRDGQHWDRCSDR
ncbi:MAG TPA: hypothetical protein VHA75_02980, partial [Rugosimonospora sp.]|nr:hypothetical protein [Rugosimonospora sp.]